MPSMKRLMVGACAAAAGVALHVSIANGQSGSVRAIFEKYNLFGTYARDCSQPPSRNNVYYVNRPLDAERIQRDQMEGPTTRTWFVVYDQARETGPGEVWVSGRFTGSGLGRNLDNEPASGTFRVEPNRMLQWEGQLAGQPLIANGKLLANGSMRPWLNKCGAR
jgi:hypothetical protein